MLAYILLSQRLEGVPVTSFHYKLLLVMGLGWMFDAMDILMIGYALPVLKRPTVWGLTDAMGLLTISVGLMGLMVGAFLSGHAADLWGRKKVFQYTVLIYSAFSLFAAFSPDVYYLMLFRFLAGIGMGGQLPVVSALLSEFVPGKSRGRFIVLLESFWAYGAVAAALIGYFVIPAYGWQAAFIVGALPALLILVIRSTVPESPRYLIAKGRLEEARAVVERVEKAAGVRPPSAEGGLAPKGGGQVELKELFSPLFRNRTVLLWILWFCMSFTYYAIFTWLPTALSVELRSVARGLEYTLIITLAQIPGYLSAAYLVERAGRKPVLTLYLILTAVSAYFFGAAHDELTIRLAGSVMSFFNLGAWGVLYTYTPELYPTRARGTGAGAASAVGRVGAILAPLTIIALTSSFFLVFALSAVLFAIGSVAVLTMGEETRGRTLEEISKETA